MRELRNDKQEANSRGGYFKRLDHPGLPKIVDIIEKKDAIWMVMEFIEGKH